MVKLLVTHFYPDLDGICGIWLLKRFGGKHFENTEIAFVPARQTWEGQVVDSNPDVIHIDTGLGMFDHHLENDYTCAAKKVFEWLDVDDEALSRIVEYVTLKDHFGEVTWPDTLEDKYDFLLDTIISGWKAEYPNQHGDYVKWGLVCLDGVYAVLRNKIQAMRIIEEDSLKFESRWGSGMAIQTFNDEVLKIGQKMGFAIVVRRDPAKHYIRIKGRPDRDDIDLTVIYEKLMALDPEATWFLHADKKQLLNGNTKNPHNVFTKLSLEEVVNLLRVN